MESQDTHMSHQKAYGWLSLVSQSKLTIILAMEDMRKDQYDHIKIEAKWQKVWTDTNLHVVDIRHAKKPFYNLMMFPYPSAEGLHIGNMYAFTGSDIYGRFKQMRGYDVFEPIGLDGFGIHSENFALKIGRHPIDHAQLTEKHFYDQLHKIGAMFDFSRTLETYDPEYYRWTQWLFIQLFKAGLAYRGTAEMNFCPSCKTVLADEQVIDGACERCGNLVEKRAMEQWFFRITAYAEKLLGNIPGLKWTEKVKTAQTNWIGKKEGINITYAVVDEGGSAVGEVTCFTTRPDTNFGATFIVIAPEHPFISQIKRVISKEQSDRITQYCLQAKNMSNVDREAVGRTKTGVATGLYCINQLTHEHMPLYISDFVLMGFGTGAVVGVPGHDKRDFQFAKTFGLPIKRVVAKDGDTSPIVTEDQVQEDEGIMVQSGFLNGFDIHKAIREMMDYLEKKRWGKRTVAYHLRDWIIGRQRYWGPPIPMIYCKQCAKEGKSWFTERDALVANEHLDPSSSGSAFFPLASKQIESRGDGQNVVRFQRTHGDFHQWNSAGWFPVLEDQLPVLLPRIEDYKPSSDGIAPLSKHKEFFDTVCPCCGMPAVRETDVSDTFLDSSWYFLKYPSMVKQHGKNRNSLYKSIPENLPFDPEITKHWLPVNMYTGGAEHSVLHLLYSRYITMVLNDLGYLDFEEPFLNFYAHGLIIKDGAKMSKSRGNVVNPDEYIAKYGADAIRLYLMFIGPFSQGGDFRDTGMEGMTRWVGKVWRIIQRSIAQGDPLLGAPLPAPPVLSKNTLVYLLEKTIAKVTDDIEKRRYNTAIASFMEFTNAVMDAGGVLGHDELQKFILLLAPFAPHMTEEAWSRLKNRELYTDPSDSIHRQSWPSYDPKILEEKEVDIIVQVNGKVRTTVSILMEDSKNQEIVEQKAKAHEKYHQYVNGSVRKVIFVPGKLINFVV